MTGEHPVWEMVDEGWGRKAVDFATLAEPNSVREIDCLAAPALVDHLPDRVFSRHGR